MLLLYKEKNQHFKHITLQNGFKRFFNTLPVKHFLLIHGFFDRTCCFLPAHKLEKKKFLNLKTVGKVPRTNVENTLNKTAMKP